MKKLIALFVFLLLLFPMSFLPAGASETTLNNKTSVFIDYDITLDTVWSGEYNYFICTTGKDLPKILNGATLTIEEGATLYFADYIKNGVTTPYENGKLASIYLQIESGHLIADGVRFTVVPSRRDRGYGGVRIYANDINPSSAVFKNCIFEYGADMIMASERATHEGGQTIDLTVSECIFQNPVPGSTGIVYGNGYHKNGKGTVRIEKSTFTGFGRGVQILRSDTGQEIDTYIDQCTFNDSSVHSLEIMDGRLASVTNCTFNNNNPESHSVQLYYGYNDSNHPDEVVLSGNVFNGSASTYPVAVHAASKINKDSDFTNTFGNDFPDEYRYAKIFGNVGQSPWSNIADTAIWGNVGMPYILNENVSIGYNKDDRMSYSHLVIKPGIRVYFEGESKLISQGKLTAEGTADLPIEFAPKPGSTNSAAWIEGSRYGQVILKHCNIYNFWKGLWFDYDREDNLNEVLVSIESCKISNTQAAAIHIEENKTPNGHISIKNSEFGSESDGDNGFVIHQSKNVSISNCLIYGYKGNGIIFHLNRQYMLLYPEALTVENCTITKNAFSGIKLEINPYFEILPDNGVVVSNSIISGNGVLNIAEDEFNKYETLSHPVQISYSLLGNDSAKYTEGVYQHEAEDKTSYVYVEIPSRNYKDCIYKDPLFADAEGYNFRLKSQTGRWDGESWVTDSVTSPAIDAGNPNDEYSSEPAPNGGRINMGYDGNTVFASKSTATEDAAPEKESEKFDFWILLIILVSLILIIFTLYIIVRKYSKKKKEAQLRD